MELGNLSERTLVRIYEQLRHGDVVKAVTASGRDGKVIAIAVEPEHYKNMVVLFSNPPKEIGKRVVLLDYEERMSKAGKNYIKAFTWIEEDKMQELEEKLKEELEKKFIEHIPEEYRDMVSKAIKGKPEDLEKVDFIAVGGDIDKESLYVAVAVDGKLYEAMMIYPPDDVKIFAAKPVLNAERMAVIPVPGIVRYKGEYIDAIVPRNEKAEKAIRALIRLERLNLPYEVEEKVRRKILERVRV